MFDFISGFFADPQLVEGYSKALYDEFIKTKNAKLALNSATEYAKQKNMSDSEIKQGKKKTAKNLETYIQTIDEISSQDIEELGSLFDNLSLSADMKQTLVKKSVYKFLICKAEAGTLYEYDKTATPLPIVYKKDEQLHFFAAAINVKKKRKTVGVNFGGPVASIRICKGFRYRLGSMNVDRQTVETYDTSDQGTFYITNQRIGYLGKTQFSFDLKKLVSIQNGEAGILLYKQGRENPYMIALDNYDVPCSILSCLLNR